MVSLHLKRRLSLVIKCEGLGCWLLCWRLQDIQAQESFLGQWLRKRPGAYSDYLATWYTTISLIYMYMYYMYVYMYIDNTYSRFCTVCQHRRPLLLDLYLYRPEITPRANVIYAPCFSPSHQGFSMYLSYSKLLFFFIYFTSCLHNL